LPAPRGGSNAGSSADRKPVDLQINVDVGNEQAVLAAAMLVPEVRKKYARSISPETFLVPDHRPIWHSIQECERLGIEWTGAVAKRICGDTLKPELLKNVLALGAAKDAAFHVEELQRDKARHAASTGPLASLIQALRDPTSAPDRVKALARHVAQAFDQVTTRSTIRDPAEVVRQVMLQVEAAARGDVYPPLGIPGLDFFKDGRRRILAGSGPGLVTIITARTGCGKTTVANQCLLGQEGVEGRAGGQRRCLLGCWEMGAEKSMWLLGCQSLGWSRSALLQGDGPSSKVTFDRITHEEKVQLEERLHELGKWIVFWDNPFVSTMRQGRRNSNEENLDVIRQGVVDAGCEFVVLDLFRFALADANPAAEDWLLNNTRRMSKEERVHLMLVNQQLVKGDAGVEMRPDKRPTLSGNKGSGGWFEAGDTFIGVHREALYKRVDDDKLQLIVLKQREGAWPLMVECDFDPDSGMISGGVERDYDQPGQAGGDVDEFMKMNVVKRGPRRKA